MSGLPPEALAALGEGPEPGLVLACERDFREGFLVVRGPALVFVAQRIGRWESMWTAQLSEIDKVSSRKGLSGTNVELRVGWSQQRFSRLDQAQVDALSAAISEGSAQPQTAPAQSATQQAPAVPDVELGEPNSPALRQGRHMLEQLRREPPGQKRAGQKPRPTPLELPEPEPLQVVELQPEGPPVFPTREELAAGSPLVKGWVPAVPVDFRPLPAVGFRVALVGGLLAVVMWGAERSMPMSDMLLPTALMSGAFAGLVGSAALHSAALLPRLMATGVAVAGLRFVLNILGIYSAGPYLMAVAMAYVVARAVGRSHPARWALGVVAVFVFARSFIAPLSWSVVDSLGLPYVASGVVLDVTMWMVLAWLVGQGARSAEMLSPDDDP